MQWKTKTNSKWLESTGGVQTSAAYLLTCCVMLSWYTNQTRHNKVVCNAGLTLTSRSEIFYKKKKSRTRTKGIECFLSQALPLSKILCGFVRNVSSNSADKDANRQVDDETRNRKSFAEVKIPWKSNRMSSAWYSRCKDAWGIRLTPVWHRTRNKH